MNWQTLNTVLIKPAGWSCNLRCAYCFYLDRGDYFPEAGPAPRMSLETAEELIRQMFLHGNNPVFAFQGGEPLLMGLEWFEKVTEIQKKYAAGLPYMNSIQTNGTLVDEKWADFFRREKFLVGLSIDGKQGLHDTYRRDAAGEGTWIRVQKAARLLQRKKVEVNALSTVNAESAKRPEETYRFLKALGLVWMQFIPIVETDPDNPDRGAPWSADPVEYGEFLKKVFDLWLADLDIRRLEAGTFNRYIDSMLMLHSGMAPGDCQLQERCGVYLVVEHDGSVYPCDFFVEPDQKLGNLHEDRLDELLNSPKQRAFGAVKAEIDDECKVCRWLPYCRGGCPKDRVRDPRDGGRNRWCESVKIFLDYAEPKIAEIAERYRRAMG